MGGPGGPVEANGAVDQGLVSADGDVGADICAGRETEDHGGHLSRRVTRLFVWLRKYPPICRCPGHSRWTVRAVRKDRSERTRAVGPAPPSGSGSGEWKRPGFRTRLALSARSVRRPRAD